MIVSNGFTNTITLHTHADYIVEPFQDAASKNTLPTLRFRPDGQGFTAAPNGIAEKYNATPGDYVLRVEGNDSTGVGGGGFQCCWTNAHVGVTVKPAAGTGG
jgi:hypothetical protein